jgi:hypothetical protein
VGINELMWLFVTDIKQKDYKKIVLNPSTHFQEIKKTVNILFGINRTNCNI